MLNSTLCGLHNEVWIKIIEIKPFRLKNFEFYLFIIMYDKLFKKKNYFNWGYNL